MLLLVVVCMIVTFFLFFLVKRKKEYLMLCALALTLAWYLGCILIYIAKKGGIGTSMNTILFVSTDLRRTLQYLQLTLTQQGYSLAIGRHLFPWLFLLTALHYSDLRLSWLRRNKWVLLILPVLSLVIYYPPVFNMVDFSIPGRSALIYGTFAWIIVYLAAGVLLLVLEPRRVRIRYIRNSVVLRCMMLMSMLILYVIYCPQDPIQIYLFYRESFMPQMGLWYLNPYLSSATYLVIMLVTIGSLGMGVFSMISITKMQWTEEQNDVRLQMKYDAASLGGSVFIHGIKNQLLANRVLCKRLNEQLDGEQPDMELIRGYARQLTENNAGLISHVEALYNSFKSNELSMCSCDMSRIVQGAISSLKRKYPAAQVELEVPEGLMVFGDEAHLRAAVTNLLTNGWEATLAAGKEIPLSVICYEKRRDVGISIRDHGVGIGKYELERIFDPFYSSKNSKSNWGLGLYYVQTIIKKHRGSLKVESNYGQGSIFYILLPKLLPERGGKGK